MCWKKIYNYERKTDAEMRYRLRVKKWRLVYEYKGDKRQQSGWRKTRWKDDIRNFPVSSNRLLQKRVEEIRGRLCPVKS